MESVEAFANRTWGEAWRLRARAHFPGDGHHAGALQEQTFAPWALFRWRARLSPAAEARRTAVERLNAAELFLKRLGHEVASELADFLKAARNSPFRFFVVAGEQERCVTLLDSLFRDDVAVEWMPEWPAVMKQSVLFGQVVQTGGVAVFTHVPVPVNLCNATAEQLLAFFRQLAMAVDARRKGGEEEDIIAENALFRLAAAHVAEGPAEPCRESTEAETAEGAAIHELLLEWEEDAPGPDMEGLSPHAPWVRMIHEGDALKLQAPGFLPMFASFRHLLHTLPTPPRPRNVFLRRTSAGR